MEPQFKLDILRVWRALVAELALKHRPLVRVLLLPTAVMAIMELVFRKFTGAATLPFTAGYWLFAAMFAVSTHRVVLLSPVALSNPWGVYVDGYVLRYIGYSLLIGFVGAFLMIGAGLLIVPLAAAMPGVMIVAVMSVLWVMLLYLMVRFGMVLPAQAIGDRAGLFEMFRASAGNGWRLVGATVLPLMGIAFLLYPLYFIADRMPAWLAFLPIALNILLTGMIGIVVLSCAYRELKGSPTFPAACITANV